MTLFIWVPWGYTTINPRGQTRIHKKMMMLAGLEHTGKRTSLPLMGTGFAGHTLDDLAINPWGSATFDLSTSFDTCQGSMATELIRPAVAHVPPCHPWTDTQQSTHGGKCNSIFATSCAILFNMQPLKLQYCQQLQPK